MSEITVHKDEYVDAIFNVIKTSLLRLFVIKAS